MKGVGSPGRTAWIRATWPAAALVLLLLLAAQPAAVADVVTMENGDRLTGTVLKAKEGELVLQTQYAGSISIRMERIAAIETETPVTVRTRGDEVFSGRLLTAGDNLRLLAGEGRGETVIDWERVRTINVPATIWTGNIFAGGVYESGNSDRLSANFGLDAIRRSRDDRFSFSFLYNYAEEDDEPTARNAYGSLKYDYFFTKAFYGLLSVELLEDEFRDLNLRTAVGPGLGYQVWGDDGQTLAFEAGVTYFSEDRIEDEDEQWMTARLATIFRYRFTSWLRFSDTLTTYPALENAGEYTLRNEATLVTSFGTAWSLRLGNIWERDSDPPPEVEEDEVTTSLALQYSY